MMQRWAPEMIRFMRDASEYGDYNQKLVHMIRPWLMRDSHVCDAGCGLGYLSLALAPHVGQVTAVDKNQRALGVLRKNCAEKRIPNITARCGDIFTLPHQQPFDSMVFCFFGGIEEILTIARRQCRGTVFAIKRNYAEHRFSVGSYREGGDSYTRAADYLREQEIPYEGRLLELEFGQPFRSFKDVRRFYEIYSHDEDPTLITDDFLWKNLEDTGHPVFPLYLPHRRKVGMLKWEAADIPDMFGASTCLFESERKHVI